MPKAGLAHKHRCMAAARQTGTR